MRIYKIVKKEENPTIQLNKVNLDDGFIIVTSDSEAVGIVVYDNKRQKFLFIDNFKNSFTNGISQGYASEKLEGLMKSIKDNFVDPVEFNFIPVEE